MKKLSETKEAMTAKLRNKNYHKIADQDLATVLDASAEFIDDKTIKVTMNQVQKN